MERLVLDLADVDATCPAGGRRQGRQPRRADPRGLPRAARRLRDHRGLPAGRGLRRDRLRRPGGRGGEALTRAAAAAREALRPAPIPAAIADAIGEAYARLRRADAGRGALVGDRRGPPVRQLRRPAGHLPERRRRRTRCSTRCAAAGRRCGPTGPSSTAPRNGIDHRRCRARRGRPADGRRRGRRACCSPPTR